MGQFDIEELIQASVSLFVWGRISFVSWLFIDFMALIVRMEDFALREPVLTVSLSSSPQRQGTQISRLSFTVFYNIKI